MRSEVGISERVIFLLLLQYYVVFISLNIVFFWWYLLFSVASVGGVSCVYLSVYYTRLWFCLFWACESVEFLWRAGSYFLSAWGSAVWSVGPVQFI